jgi:hypothetical protein
MAAVRSDFGGIAISVKIRNDLEFCFIACRDGLPSRPYDRWREGRQGTEGGGCKGLLQPGVMEKLARKDGHADRHGSNSTERARSKSTQPDPREQLENVRAANKTTIDPQRVFGHG